MLILENGSHRHVNCSGDIRWNGRQTDLGIRHCYQDQKVWSTGCYKLRLLVVALFSRSEPPLCFWLNSFEFHIKMWHWKYCCEFLLNCKNCKLILFLRCKFRVLFFCNLKWALHTNWKVQYCSRSRSVVRDYMFKDTANAIQAQWVTVVSRPGIWLSAFFSVSFSLIESWVGCNLQPLGLELLITWILDGVRPTILEFLRLSTTAEHNLPIRNDTNAWVPQGHSLQEGNVVFCRPH